MGQLRALRPACRARGVKYAGIVVGLDRRHGQLGGAGDRIRPLDRLDRWRRLTHCHHSHIGKVSGNLGEHRQSLIVRDQYLGFGVIERIGHLVSNPPRVHAHNDAAHRNHTPVGENPLRVVAQRDGHAVSRAYALSLQPRSKIRDDLSRLGKGPALVAINDIFLVGITLAEHPQISH